MTTKLLGSTLAVLMTTNCLPATLAVAGQALAAARDAQRSPAVALNSAVSPAGQPASRPAIRAVVDPRVELMSIIFRLAGNPEYNMPNSKSALCRRGREKFRQVPRASCRPGRKATPQQTRRQLRRRDEHGRALKRCRRTEGEGAVRPTTGRAQARRSLETDEARDFLQTGPTVR